MEPDIACTQYIWLQILPKFCVYSTPMTSTTGGQVLILECFEGRLPLVKILEYIAMAISWWTDLCGMVTLLCNPLVLISYMM